MNDSPTGTAAVYSDQANESLKAAEAENAASAQAPRISLADIEAAIARVDYLNAGAAVAACEPNDEPKDISNPLYRVMLAFVTLHNGFVVIGYSAPMDMKNYDPKKGAQLAYEQAVRQIWPLMAHASLDAEYYRPIIEATVKANLEAEPVAVAEAEPATDAPIF